MKRELSTAATVGIAVAAGILIASLIGGVGTAIFNATHQMPNYSYVPVPYEPKPFDPPDGDYSDLAQGEPGSPIAVSPLHCSGPCFDETSAEAAIMPDETFDDWNLPIFKHVWNMTGDRTTAADLQAQAWQMWDASGFTPEECIVTVRDQPFVESRAAVVSDDVIAPLTEHTSDLYSVSRVVQSVRLFPDTASAESYMATLAAGVSTCTRFEDNTGYGFDVTPEPGIHPSASVAAVGFVKTPEPGTRYYVMDIQRGNMVIRSVGVSDGGIDDTSFRTLMQKQALAVSELEPAG